MKKLFLFLSLSFAAMCPAQEVQKLQGQILDRKNKTPLMGASVFIDGSTLGTITDEEGAFELELPKSSLGALIVRYLGFETLRITPPFVSEYLILHMEESPEELSEVVLTSDPFSRRQKLKAFRLEFLGDGRAAKRCTILNEDDISLFFNSYNNTLTARAKRPIRIWNNHLGYEVIFELQEFEVAFRSRSLMRTDNVYQTKISGTTQFVDIGVTNREIYKKRRIEAYVGSAMHFMRSVYYNELFENFFTFRVNLEAAATNEVIRIEAPDKAGLVEFCFNQEQFTLIHQNDFYERTPVKANIEVAFTVDPYGNYQPYGDIIYGGYISEARVGLLLPIDYQLPQQGKPSGKLPSPKETIIASGK